MTLRRRVLFSGFTTSLLYAGLVLFAGVAAGGLKPLHQVVPAVSIGLATAFLIGAFVFGVVPHFLGKFMESSSSTFDFINKASLAVALVSIVVGVVASLLLILGISQATRPLLVAITLFAGSAAALCSLKFFHANRGGT